MDLKEAIDFLETHGYKILDEDFGIGVGGECGLDQGIPHGGDCKGCCPQRMGPPMHRPPFHLNPFFHGVPAAHHPEYWLSQLIAKKKKKKRKRKKNKNG